MYWFATQYQYPQTSTLRSKNKIHFKSNLGQIWTTLHPTSKNTLQITQNLIWLISAWKTYVVRRSGSEGWQESYKKYLKVTRIANVIFLRKFKKPISSFQIEVFSFLFFSVSSMFIIFCWNFWLLLEQQSDRGHISIRCQISIIL